MNAMNNKIISRFYVITLNKKPVYVGYTNRPILQRFNEHKHDKDFGKIEPEIEQIAQLEYEFTWDTNQIDQYAHEVNDKECELIKQFKTQNSKYQKANGGGQNWADIKYFVNTNHNNPKFLNMPESDVLKRIENEHNINKYVNDFTKNIGNSTTDYMRNFIYRMNTSTASAYLANFTQALESKPETTLKHFVKDMTLPIDSYISGFIKSMHSTNKNYDQNNECNYHVAPLVYLNGFINKMIMKPNAYMQNFTQTMNSISESRKYISKSNPDEYLKGCIKRMDSKINIYLKNCIKHMHSKPNYYLEKFIERMTINQKDNQQ